MEAMTAAVVSILPGPNPLTYTRVYPNGNRADYCLGCNRTADRGCQCVECWCAEPDVDTRLAGRLIEGVCRGCKRPRFKDARAVSTVGGGPHFS